MKTIQFYRRGFITLMGAALITGCSVSVPPPSGGTPPGFNPPPPPSGGPPPAPEQPSIFLQANSFYSGRDSSGKKIRAFASRSGEIIRVDSKTGRNFSQTYRYRSGNTYRSGNYSVTVTSARSFTWNGPFGNVTMND
ncbi:MAG: hypothetical protein AAGF25_02025 [Pseudomonadota bacterium]